MLIEVELHAEFAAAQARQAAADDVDRPQQPLRQQRRDEDRDRERGAGDGHRRAERRVEILPDQQRRDTDPDCADLRTAEEQRLAELEVLSLAGVNRDQLRQRRQLLTLEQRIGMGDGEAVCVDDRRERDVLRVQTRFEHRAQTRIGAHGLERIDAVGH